MAETIAMPKLGFDMQEGTLVRWVRSEGESVNKGDVIAEIETDKATVEVESSASGIVRKLLVDKGAVVPIGAAIAIIGSKDEKIDVPSEGSAPASDSAPGALAAVSAPGAPEASSGAAKPPQGEIAPSEVGRASPLARRMALEAKLDLGQVRGSGPGGRVVRRDIEAALAAPPAPQEGLAQGRYPAPILELRPRQDEWVPLSKLRLAIGRRMAESKASVPHFYVTHEYRIEAALDLRAQANSVLPEDQKISVNDFVIKAAALCLREFPNLNSSFHGDRVLRHGAVHIGVAVAVEGGLLTVVCRDADQKSLRQISAEVRAMASRARAGKVHPADIEGSTFTVSNLGMFDVENFGAIINPPEAGILAVGSALQVPVISEGQIRPGWRMKATLAVDHRVSDGAEAARFMQALAKYLETPLSLFL
jgi:pyruvate dehydrogenase E2 component (dihydrolipoamide acetyltransferase)